MGGGQERSAGTTRPLPRSHRGAVPGDQRGTAGSPPPPPPPSPPPTRGQPEDGQGDGGPAPPPARPGGDPPPREGRDTQGGAPLPRQALPYAACLQSAAHPLPQCPRQAGSPAPTGKGAPWAAAGRQHSDVSQCSVKGGAQTKRPTLVPTRGERRSRLQQSDLPAPCPAGAPRPSPRGGAAHRPPPPNTLPARLTDWRPGLANGPGRKGIPWGDRPAMKDSLSRKPQSSPPEEGGMEPRRAAASPLPPLPPSGPRDARDGPQGHRPPAPSRTGGTSPLPSKGPRRRGGGRC